MLKFVYLLLDILLRKSLQRSVFLPYFKQSVFIQTSLKAIKSRERPE